MVVVGTSGENKRTRSRIFEAISMKFRFSDPWLDGAKLDSLEKEFTVVSWTCFEKNVSKTYRTLL